ncbi:MAG: hypothetical protein HQ522_20855 [Bacteroidetes bacterium]|nr:hypothetical protein [Bacteroidota bacterium]
MSLGIIVKCPEGLVLAAESRVTINANTPVGQVHNNFDNAKKLLGFNGAHKHIGVITYGLGSLQLRTAQSFMPEFESSLPENRLSVVEFAEQLGKFFMEQWKIEGMPAANTWKDSPMIFLVAGFDEGEPYGKVCELNIPHNPKPKIIRDTKDFGVNWGGQREIVDRLIKGYDNRVLDVIQHKLGLTPEQIVEINNELAPLQMQIPVQIMALQDCIDLANFILKTTISGQELSIGVRGCGGNIDVAVITRTTGINFIKQKELQAK